MDQHLYVDTAARKLVAGPQSGNAPKLGPYFQGDTLDVYIHGQKPNPDTSSLDSYVEDPITFTKIRFGIGIGPDAPPSGGTFKVRLKGKTETTAALTYNVAQAEFAAALNGLASVKTIDAEGIKLDTVDGQKSNFFLIRWNNPEITAQFEIVENRLEPYSQTRSIVTQLPGGQLQLLKYIVPPFAFTDQFSYPAAAPVVVASVRTGNGTRNCVQSITVPPNAVGTFALLFLSNATEILSVDSVSLDTDGSSAIQDALNNLYSDGATRFSVTRQDYGFYYVELTGALAKQDFALLDVEMHEQAPQDTPTGQLVLDGPSLEIALRGQPQATFVLELEITNGTRVGTPIQQNVVVINDMIDDDMAVAADPAWLQTIKNPVSYPDYDPSPAANIIGQQFYVQVVGAADASASAFVVTHNLGTLNCHVTTRENGGDNLLLPHNQYDTVYLDQNRIKVDFGRLVQPNEFVVIISSSAENSVFLHHTHPISDIIGLQDILNALSASGNPLDLWPSIPESKLPDHIGWKNAAGNAYRFDVLPDDLLPPDVPHLDEPGGTLAIKNLPPGVPYIDPSTGALVVTFAGPPAVTITLLDPTGHIPVETLPVDPSGWTGLVQAILKALQAGATVPNLIVFEVADYAEQFPPVFELSNHCPEDATVATLPSSIMPAIFNAPLSGALTGGLPPASGAAYAGKRFTVTGSANSPATIYRERQTFLNGDVIASNGYHWYKVDVQGNTCYPLEYNRELFSFYVAADMLVKASRFAVDFTLQAQFATADLVRARYLLTVEIGAPVGATGNGICGNLTSVDWYKTVIQEVIILSSANTYHHFNYAVACDATTGALTATAGVYAQSGLPANVPVSPGFVVRATLTAFDVEDTVNNPTGQITLKMLKTVASIVKATS